MYIKISVNNKIATLQDNVLIVNGNSDYVIKFDFDAEWDAYQTKTARFVTARGYTDVVFSGDEVALPVITDAISVRVGVYAGNLHTTTPAVIFCRRSITDGSGSPVEPTPDVYAQLMEMLNKDSGIWYPNVDDAGTISWVRSIAETEPTPINIKGPIGETGAQGSQGEKGPKGDKGDTGAQGPKGDTGDTGPTGPEGPQGPKGDAFTYADFTAEQLAALKGEKGDTGATGPQGPAGAPGKDGAGMDITGATVGQIAKITAVDASGVPTAWSPVDMPSGGGTSEASWHAWDNIIVPEGGLNAFDFTTLASGEKLSDHQIKGMFIYSPYAVSAKSTDQTATLTVNGDYVFTLATFARNTSGYLRILLTVENSQLILRYFKRDTDDRITFPATVVKINRNDLHDTYAITNGSATIIGYGKTLKLFNRIESVRIESSDQVLKDVEFDVQVMY